MKKFFILISGMFTLLNTNTHAQTIFSQFPSATGNYSTSTTGICLGCSFTNPDFVADNTLTNSATLVITAGISYTRTIRAKLNGTALGGSKAGFYMGVASLVSSLPTVTIRTYKAGALVETLVSGGSLLTLLSSATGFACLTSTTGNDYDEVGITFTATLATIGMTADIYYAFGGSTICGVMLPVKFISTNVSSSANRVQVSWISEDDGLTTYTLQRGTNNGSSDDQFLNLASLISSAGHGEKSFSLDDTKPNPGMNYYRLQVNENNGTPIKYSKIIPWNHGATQTPGPQLIIYPNPVSTNQITLSGTLTDSENLIWKITDVCGRPVCNGTLKTTASNLHLITLNQKPNPGIYIFQITDPKKSQSASIKIMFQ